MSGDAQTPPRSETRHATAVALAGHGVLILGASGSGKSSLAIELISRGAKLISDDRVTIITGPEGWPILTGTGRLTGVIEARGVGLLTVPHVVRAPLAVVIDMGSLETERLPGQRTLSILGTSIPCLHRVDSPAFPASIWAYLTGGRVA